MFLIIKGCLKCSLNSFKYNFENSFICRRESFLLDSSKIPNCKKYHHFFEKNVKCVLCNEGYTVDIENNSCILISACTGTVKLASLNDFYEFTIFDDLFSYCDKEGTLATCGVEALANGIYFI